MGIIRWGLDPWGRAVPLHIAGWLLWAALLAGSAFMVVHAALVFLRPKSRLQPEAVPPDGASRIPEEAPRHSLPARIFHWVMAAAVLALLFSAFLPWAGLRFAWVKLHWTAGVVLVIAILFHLVHSLFFMDFRSIWPDKADLDSGRAAIRRLFGRVGSLSGKPGKYPLGNKLYHLAVMVCGLCSAVTGVLMMSRVHTSFFTRNPYIFTDMTRGIIYLLHGFAGVALVALVAVHVYFALRPEKLPVTRAMIYGGIRQKSSI